VVLFVVDAARSWFGAAGVLASGAVLGLTDVDALTVTMARGATPASGIVTAARAITVGVLANTGLKLAATIVLGSSVFRLRCGVGLVATATALAAALMW
jgi:uncharacterized membrane protein (DUF4010 family)